ncbi:MAG: Ppx/GppA phosphatase family protein [Alphaproteobacteria bacterium]
MADGQGVAAGHRELPGAMPRAGRAAGAGAVYAALDLGTNNCRMLAARDTGDGFAVIDAYSRTVRLGERLLQDGRLCERAMSRAIAALRVCAQRIRRHEVAGLRGVATEACRRAGNGRAFLARVAAETGLAFDIIDAREEAGLALAGCAPLFAPAIGAAATHGLLVDIGGGSTQVAWAALAPGDAIRIVDTVSLPFGVVTLLERWGADPDATGDRAMRAEVERHLAPFVARHGIGAAIAAGRVHMVGTSGTVTMLASVAQGLGRYNRARVDGYVLDFAAIHDHSAALARLGTAGRAQHPCIGRERADLTVGGCIVLRAICDVLPVGRLTVADRGLREGILLGLMADARRRADA